VRQGNVLERVGEHGAVGQQPGLTLSDVCGIACVGVFVFVCVCVCVCVCTMETKFDARANVVS
jgi:hypothetical protein